MRYLMVVFLLLSGCTNSPKTKTNLSTNVVRGSIGNTYEIIEVGPYTCVGMDGEYSGAIWCERPLK